MTANPWGAVLAFVVVLALIPLALALLKRTPIVGTSTPGPLRVIGQQAIGQQQRLVTVEWGHGEERRWLLLGVSAGGISTLHQIAAPAADAAVPAAPVQTPFAQLLGLLQGRAGKPQEPNREA